MSLNTVKQSFGEFDRAFEQSYGQMEMRDVQKHALFNPELRINTVVNKPIVGNFMEIDYKAVTRDFEYLNFYVTAPNQNDHDRFLATLDGVLNFCCDQGQKRCISNFMSTLNEINILHRYGAYSSGSFHHYLAVSKNQLRKVQNLFFNNTVIAQHYGFHKIARRSECDFYVEGAHKYCKKHGSYPFSYRSMVSLGVSPTDVEVSLPLKGLIDRNAAFGTFANFQEYSRYCALIAKGRYSDARDMAAALGGGAHAHTMRDPFPFGYCFLLLFKQEAWSKIFVNGTDCLTKRILNTNRADLDLKKTVVFTYDNPNNQAHISMHRVLPAGGTSVFVRVEDLVAELDKAFADGVCEYEELEEIWHNLEDARNK